MEPRYKPTWLDTNVNDKPTWLDTNVNEVLIGQAGALDIYYEHNEDHDEDWLIVVGPEERKVADKRHHNFDVYEIRDGNRLVPNADEKQDIHVELAEMCEIYALAIKLGYMEER
jgi:hypothetical protein